LGTGNKGAGKHLHEHEEYLLGLIHGNRLLSKATRKAFSCASAWSKNVMARDAMVCQLCGTTEGEMHAHHVIPRSVSAEFRGDVDNGITLCAPCHRKWHSVKAVEKAVEKMKQENKARARKRLLKMAVAIQN